MGLLLLVILLFLSPAVMADSCHSDRNKDHRPRVSCVGMSLSSVPTATDPSTEVLVLSQNLLTSLNWGVYSGFPGLHELDLSQNRVGTLEGSGTVLSNLSVLHLSNNLLVEVGDRSFVSAPQLRELYLRGNQLRSLHPGSFSGLPILEVLDLSRNQLTSLPPDLLTQISSTNLKTLDLEDNRILLMPHNWFSSKPELPYVFLSKNPWRCFCDVGYLQVYLDDQAHNVYIHTKPQSANPLQDIENNADSVVCASPPSLANRPIIDLSEEEYCDPSLPSEAPAPPLTFGDADRETTTPMTTTTDHMTTSYPTTTAPATTSTAVQYVTRTLFPVTTTAVSTTLPTTTTVSTTLPTTTTVSTTLPTTTTTVPTTLHTTTTVSTTLPTTTTVSTTLPTTTTTVPTTTSVSTTLHTTTAVPTTTSVSTTLHTTTAVPTTTSVSTTLPTTTAVSTTLPTTKTVSTTLPYTTTPSQPSTFPSGKIIFAGSYGERAGARIWCTWLLAGLLLLCVLSALISGLLGLGLVWAYLTLYQPLARRVAGAADARAHVRLLDYRNMPNSDGETAYGVALAPVDMSGGVQATFRSVLFIAKGGEGDEVEEKKKTEGDEQGSNIGEGKGHREGETDIEAAVTRTELGLKAVGAGVASVKRRHEGETEANRGESKEVFRKTLYRVFSREEEIEGWKEVEEHWEEQRGVEEGGEKNSRKRISVIGGAGVESKTRYSLILREEKAEGDSRAEEQGMEWLVGEWEMGGFGGGMSEGQWESLISGTGEKGPPFKDPSSK